MIAKLKELYANHRNFVELKERCGIRGFGFPKRLDEHRELVEIIIKSGLLRDKPWVAGWLHTQDEFLEFCFLKLFGVDAISEAIKYRMLREKPNYDELICTQGTFEGFVESPIFTPPSQVYFVKNKAERLADINATALLICPDPSPSPNDAYWDREARELFVGMALLVAETQDQIEKDGIFSIAPGIPTTLRELYLQVSVLEELKPFLARLLQKCDYLSEDCVTMLTKFIELQPEVQSAIFTTLLSNLKKVGDEIFNVAADTKHQ